MVKAESISFELVKQGYRSSPTYFLSLSWQSKKEINKGNQTGKELSLFCFDWLAKIKMHELPRTHQWTGKVAGYKNKYTENLLFPTMH